MVVTPVLLVVSLAVATLAGPHAPHPTAVAAATEGASDADPIAAADLYLSYDELAGVYIDTGHGGRVVIGVTTAAAARKMRGVLGRTTTPYKIVRMRYSLAYLRAKQDLITDAARELDALGVRWTMTAVDEQANAVHVGVDSDVHTARRVLGERFPGVPLRVTREEGLALY